MKMITILSLCHFFHYFLKLLALACDVSFSVCTKSGSLACEARCSRAIEINR